VGTFGGGVRALAVGKDGWLAAGSMAGELRLWAPGKDMPTPRSLLSSGAPVVAVAFAPFRPLLAAAGKDGTVRVWDLERLEAPPLSITTGGAAVASLAFGPQRFEAGVATTDQTLLAGTPKGALLWQLWRPEAPPLTVCGASDVRGIAFSPRLALLACGERNGGIVVQPFAGLVPGGGVQRFVGHASSVNALAFGPRGESLVSASSDGTVRLWNARDKAKPPVVLSGHESWVWTVAFSPDGAHLVSGGADRTVRVWPAGGEALAREICARGFPPLSEEEWRSFLPENLPYHPEHACSVLSLE
ncbi:MAG TPA: hypothetical protein VN923_12880, partial [Thermoanaerobaculia bacterium]|nr:hypothetical protein [Thermoanaerobaculia bacterium]